MTRFLWVRKFEWLDLVLKNIREGKKASLTRLDAPDGLNSCFILFNAKDDRKPIMVVLLVLNIYCKFVRGLLAESKRGGRDVRRGIIVQCCSADMFVLE